MTPSAQKSDEVFDRLSKVSQFAFGGVGFAGLPSQGELDYRQIIARPTAAADFEKLFQTGNLQAKCYALAGLFTINNDGFTKLAKPLHSSDAKVSTMVGCVMSHRPISALIHEIESGVYLEKK